jgi:hypothetical protein
MQLTKHIAASAATSAGIYAATRSAEMAVLSFFAGFLIDIDHLADYWREYSFNIDIRKFFRACHECDFTIARLFFHSIEAIVLLSIVAYLTRSAVITAITLGITQHIFFDQLANKVYPASYFFVYRWFNGFEVAKVFSNIECGE